MMAFRSGDDLRRRHEGYIYNDLLAATLRFNRNMACWHPRTQAQLGETE
jgi:hypothetical protein